MDLIASDDPLFAVVPGDLATRAGNFTVQNADVLLVLGSRLGLRQVSYNWDSFARFAHKIQVDIDEVEFQKPTVKIDQKIHADVKHFLAELFFRLNKAILIKKNMQIGLLGAENGLRVIRQSCRVIVKKRRTALIHIILSNAYLNNSNSDDVVICGNGTANVVAFQAANLEMGQRLIANTGDASMGYDLPAAIGASIARPGKRVVCLAGDGSLQLNLQEFQTVVQYKLPIKLFVLESFRLFIHSAFTSEYVQEAW